MMKASEYKNEMTPVKTKKPADATIDPDELITVSTVELHKLWGVQCALDKLKEKKESIKTPF